MASGGDTRMKMRILSKFLAHCGREDVEVGAGPPGAEPGWLAPDARGSYRPAAEWSEGCVPHPVLKDWAKHYDDSRHLARGQFYDPVVRLRDRLDAAAAAGAPATVVCLGSAETLRRLLDLDADALSRDGRDISLALAQVQLALTHVCRADPCRDFLAGALAAFLGRRRTRTPSSCSCGGPTGGPRRPSREAAARRDGAAVAPPEHVVLRVHGLDVAERRGDDDVAPPEHRGAAAGSRASSARATPYRASCERGNYAVCD
ncbi:hypothetical protein JL722_13536 [Aureococcus anophagefferens]|nr:hypothetical protein JL722_13536 [Aureococcus anophagefferens]